MLRAVLRRAFRWDLVRSIFSAPGGRRGAPRSHLRARLAVEPLEERSVLSALPPVSPVAAPGTTQAWVARDEQIADAPRNNAAVLFLGDSITNRFANGLGAAVWEAQMAPLPADDFGIDGNTTQNVLWQINEGDLRGFAPKVVVLMVGVNDLANGGTPAQTASGVQACVSGIEASLPSARVLLLGILPADQSPTNPLRTAIAQANALLSPLADGQRVRFLDVGASFLQADGTISSDILVDYVHPTQAGYSLLASAIGPTLQTMLAEAPLTGGGSPASTERNHPAVPSTIGMVDPTSTWYLRTQNSGGAPALSFAYGLPGWTPLTGDWDGDGTTGIGAFDPGTATFYLRNEPSGGAPDAAAPFAYGAPGWVPLAGDWNRDGTDTVGAFDPVTATWYLRDENSGGAPDGGTFAFGPSGSMPLVGDWEGTGHVGIGVFDPHTATFYLKDTIGPGAADLVFQYGAPGWKPVVGDWDGDGKDTVAVIDPSGEWYLSNANAGGAPARAPFAYGLGSWTPVAGIWDGGARPTSTVATATSRGSADSSGPQALADQGAEGQEDLLRAVFATQVGGDPGAEQGQGTGLQSHPF